MKRLVYTGLLLLGLSVFLSCAPCRYVKPLDKKQQAASLTFGGPVIRFAGAALPMPFITAGYGYGLSSKVTLYGNLHLTSMAFSNLQTDMGASIRIYEKTGHYGFSVGPALQFATSFKAANSTRLWPSCDLNSYFHVKKSPSYVYGGVNVWLETSTTRAHKEPQPQQIIPNLHIGYQHVTSKWQQQVQLSYLSPGTKNLPGVVDYVGLAGKGSFGLYYAVIRLF